MNNLVYVKLVTILELNRFLNIVNLQLSSKLLVELSFLLHFANRKEFACMITSNTGQDQVNLPTNILILQLLFNKVSIARSKQPNGEIIDYLSVEEADKDSELLPELKIDIKCLPQLIERIKAYQRAKGMKVIDGWISPQGPTIKSLIKDAKIKTVPDRMTFIRSEIKPSLAVKSIKPNVCINLYQAQYKPLTSSDKSGLEYILKTAKTDQSSLSIAELAYMLATTKHETAHTFRAISEYGEGKGRPYGKVVEVQYTDPLKKTTTYKNQYYGRGFVQITWGFNYQRIDEKLGNGIYPNKNKTKDSEYNKGFTITNPDKSIYLHPDQALEKEKAYVAMMYGMQKGIFTGKKISDYINSLKIDYRSARKVINGTDKANQIADYAEDFEIFLLASTQ